MLLVPHRMCCTPVFPACCLLLQNIGFSELAAEWAPGQHADVVTAGTCIVRSRISRLAELLRAGQVAVQVRCWRLSCRIVVVRQPCRRRLQSKGGLM
jgi:hypothetical protein